jgi:hypothetical protein
MSEYYKSGGNGYVPTTVPELVTAASLAGSNSTNLRGPQFGGYNPAINSTTPSGIYTHQLWADNGSTGTVNRTFTVNKTGTYNIYFGWYSYSLTAPLTVQVNGSNVYYATLTSYNSTVSTSGTFTASSGDTIGIITSFPSSGWSGHYTYIGGNSSTSRNIDIAVNSGIPVSGNPLAISDFYGGRKT